MGCHAPSEDVDDDEREFLAAAQEDAAVVANLLIRLSRSDPGRRLQGPTPPPVEEEEPRLMWGRRRARSRWITMEGVLAAKREEARRASPTTPLSWSGGSGTSGSVCGDGWSIQSRPPKRRKQQSLDEKGEARRPSDSAPGQAELSHDAKPALSSPAKMAKPELSGDGAPALKRMKVEATDKDGEPHRVFVAFGSSPGSGSNKAVVPAAAEGAEATRPSARVGPLGLRLTGEGGRSVIVRRPGKKKTLPELKALTDSLLLEQVELKKELEGQKKIYEALLEENTELKSLESSLVSSHAVGKSTASPAPHEAAESEQPRHTDQPCSDPRAVKGQGAEQHQADGLQHTRLPASGPRRALLLDLNLPPGDDL